MRITGYSDRWSVQPGETITFYVSSQQPTYQASLVRLIHGDNNPNGPGVKEETIDCPRNGEYAGVEQKIYLGSCVVIDNFATFRAEEGFTFAGWIRPTAPQLGYQAVIGQYGTDDNGFALRVTPEGSLEAVLGIEGRVPLVLSLGRLISTWQWQFVAIAFDAVTKELTLRHDFTKFSGTEPSVTASLQVDGTPAFAPSRPITIGAATVVTQGIQRIPQECFNGRVARPLLFKRALTGPELDELTNGQVPDSIRRDLIAEWDFSHEQSRREIPDRTGNRLDGRTINRPMRAVTGPFWTGNVERFSEAPQEYDAIHFHDDDLEDAAWSPSFSFDIPADFKSGVYAFKLTGTEAARDYLPFVVRPLIGTANASMALLLPTLSYMAYSDDRLGDMKELAAIAPLFNGDLLEEEQAYLCSNNLRSLYDHHNDGTGVSNLTMLRPNLASFRPYYRARPIDSPHQFSADLWLIDWLEVKGIAYDVITDHDLHREGGDLLKNYRTIVSGTHAEYWTTPMLDALEGYQEDGGRFVCLSGNSLVMVIGVDPETHTMAELRRARTVGSWVGESGEDYISFSDELGSYFSHRGRPTRSYIGTSTVAAGFDEGKPFRRTPDSHNPRAAFIFEGVEGDTIGNFPVLCIKHGAAGFEIDRTDFAGGTPEHTLVLATATGFSSCYMLLFEEMKSLLPGSEGPNPNLRADMVFFETPKGGAVFNASSISWCSGLSYNNYDNEVSRITENVIRAFSHDGPLPGHEELINDSV